MQTVSLISGNVCTIGFLNKRPGRSAHLTGSVGRVWDSWSWCHEFEFHVGCRDYVKSLKKKERGPEVQHFGTKGHQINGSSLEQTHLLRNKDFTPSQTSGSM